MKKKDKNDITSSEKEIETKDLKVKNFKEDIDKYIKEKLNDEAKKTVNIKDYKEQIDKYVKERVEIESASQSVKLLKKQLKSKKISSGIKSFIILCLLACIGYGAYYLYKDGYFDENKNEKCNCPVNNCKNITPDKDVKPDDSKDKNEVKLSDLVKEYGYLLENIKFDANSNYTRNFYNGNLTDELKEYLAFKLIDEEAIESDEDSSYFELENLSIAYSKLFSEKLSPLSFKYNNAVYKYLSSKEMFVANTKANDVKEVTKEIINIEVLDDKVIITTVEGYINQNNKLYNILSNKEIGSYKNGQELAKHKNKLNTIKYVFEDEYLVDLEK